MPFFCSFSNLFSMHAMYNATRFHAIEKYLHFNFVPTHFEFGKTHPCKSLENSVVLRNKGSITVEDGPDVSSTLEATDPVPTLFCHPAGANPSALARFRAKILGCFRPTPLGYNNFLLGDKLARNKSFKRGNIFLFDFAQQMFHGSLRQPGHGQFHEGNRRIAERHENIIAETE